MTALLALECSSVGAGRSRLELRQQHAVLVALRAFRPLDGGNMLRRYRLKLGHDASLDLRSVTNSLRLKPPASPDVISENEPSGIARRGQNCSLRKTFFVKMKRSSSDRSHCDSNTGLFVPHHDADALPPDTNAPFVARIWRASYQSLYRILEPPVSVAGCEFLSPSSFPSYQEQFPQAAAAVRNR